MPRAHTTKFKDEHHIFVKNVPAELGIAAVPNLFEQYKPTRIKNVYPTSNITTIVVTFGTYEEAEQAQEDIDGTRLENVVLRVEMYDKRRSLRYLKDTRNTHRPHFGHVEEGYEDEDEAEQPEEPIYVHPFGTPRQGTPDPSTWAGIVGKDRGKGMTPLPAPKSAVQTEHLAPPNDATYIQRTKKIAGIYVGDEAAPSDYGSMDVLPPSSETASTTDQDTSTTDSERPAPAARTSIFVPWESFNSTERIIQRHCRDCAFCKKRLAWTG